jgi:hypothetical protein
MTMPMKFAGNVNFKPAITKYFDEGEYLKLRMTDRFHPYKMNVDIKMIIC